MHTVQRRLVPPSHQQSVPPMPTRHGLCVPRGRDVHSMPHGLHPFPRQDTVCPLQQRQHSVCGPPVVYPLPCRHLRGQPGLWPRLHPMFPRLLLSHARTLLLPAVPSLYHQPFAWLGRLLLRSGNHQRLCQPAVRAVPHRVVFFSRQRHMCPVPARLLQQPDRIHCMYSMPQRHQGTVCRLLQVLQLQSASAGRRARVWLPCRTIQQQRHWKLHAMLCTMSVAILLHLCCMHPTRGYHLLTMQDM